MRPLLATTLLVVVLLAGCDGGPAHAAGADVSDRGSAAPPIVDLGQGKGGIDGVVVDAAVRPLAGALVLLQPVNVSAISNADGQFAFSGLDPGDYIVNATHTDYKGAQTTATVVVGEPAKVRLLLTAVRNLSPNVVRDGAELLVSSGFCVATYCNKVFSGDSDEFQVHDIAYFEVNDQPTTVQVEVQWDATVTVVGEGGLLECAVYGDDPEGSTAGIGYAVQGPSPLTLRMPGTWVDEDSGAAVKANGMSCELSNANGDSVPASTMVQQQADLFVHYFYNFVPKEGWTFIADGDYPVPP